MSKKIVWGLGILIILFIGVSVVVVTRTTDTKPPITIYRGDTEPLNPNPTLNTNDNPPPAEPGYKWVWHHNHWDKVKIAEANQPIKHQDIQIAEVSQETPVIDEQASEEPALSALDENFYKKYSRERLKESIKSYQQSSDLIQTVNIPDLEERRDKYVKFLESKPDNKYYKEGLARVTAEINWYKSVIRNSEKLITVMSNVLNEEETNVEK